MSLGTKPTDVNKKGADADEINLANEFVSVERSNEFDGVIVTLTLP